MGGIKEKTEGKLSEKRGGGGAALVGVAQTPSSNHVGHGRMGKLKEAKKNRRDLKMGKVDVSRAGVP